MGRMCNAIRRCSRVWVGWVFVMFLGSLFRCVIRNM